MAVQYAGNWFNMQKSKLSPRLRHVQTSARGRNAPVQGPMSAQEMYWKSKNGLIRNLRFESDRLPGVSNGA